LQIFCPIFVTAFSLSSFYPFLESFAFNIDRFIYFHFFPVLLIRFVNKILLESGPQNEESSGNYIITIFGICIVVYDRLLHFFLLLV
jgi:hypothetical protein